MHNHSVLDANLNPIDPFNIMRTGVSKDTPIHSYEGPIPKADKQLPLCALLTFWISCEVGLEDVHSLEPEYIDFRTKLINIISINVRLWDIIKKNCKDKIEVKIANDLIHAVSLNPMKLQEIWKIIDPKIAVTSEKARGGIDVAQSAIENNYSQYYMQVTLPSIGLVSIPFFLPANTAITLKSFFMDFMNKAWIRSGYPSQVQNAENIAIEKRASLNNFMNKVSAEPKNSIRNPEPEDSVDSEEYGCSMTSSQFGNYIKDMPLKAAKVIEGSDNEGNSKGRQGRYSKRKGGASTGSQKEQVAEVIEVSGNRGGNKSKRKGGANIDGDNTRVSIKKAIAVDLRDSEDVDNPKVVTINVTPSQESTGGRSTRNTSSKYRRKQKFLNVGKVGEEKVWQPEETRPDSDTPDGKLLSSKGQKLNPLEDQNEGRIQQSGNTMGNSNNSGPSTSVGNSAVPGANMFLDKFGLISVIQSCNKLGHIPIDMYKTPNTLEDLITLMQKNPDFKFGELPPWFYFNPYFNMQVTQSNDGSDQLGGKNPQEGAKVFDIDDFLTYRDSSLIIKEEYQGPENKGGATPWVDKVASNDNNKKQNDALHLKIKEEYKEHENENKGEATPWVDKVQSKDDNKKRVGGLNESTGGK